MDHQDWHDWSGDESSPDDADTADPNRPDDPISDLGDFGGHGDPDPGGDSDFDDGYGHSGHDLGQDPAEGVPGHASLYPEDDPFAYPDGDSADAGHGGHAGFADDAGLPADHDETGHDAAHHDVAHHDGPEHDGPEHDAVVPADHLVGTDPDVDPHADHAGWDDPQFPPHLDLHQMPEPVDGYPWSDAGNLGTGLTDDGSHLQAGWSTPSHHELFDYAGLEVPGGGGDPWQALLGSDDPAAGALARWWAPGT